MGEFGESKRERERKAKWFIGKIERQKRGIV